MAAKLAENISKSKYVQNCIIVDSGDNEFIPSLAYSLVRSSHKNQPYQRYLGYKASISPWLLYLDDDMEPLDEWDEEIIGLILTKGTDGYGVFAIKFEDKHANSYLSNSEYSVFHSKQPNALLKVIRWFSGYPILKNGAYKLNGVKGRLPQAGGDIEYIGGGAFLVKRDILFKNFNMQLFSFYEKRMGKGEDGILGYTLSKISKVYFYSKTLFIHNDQGNSVYTENDYQFNKIFSFSRAYLSLEYCRLNNMSPIIGRLSFINFSFWRLVGLSVNAILKPNRIKTQRLKGYISGSLTGLNLNFTKELDKYNKYWEAEAEKDISKVVLPKKEIIK